MKFEKANPKKTKNEEMDELVVYEPVRRTDKEAENTIAEKLKITKEFCGLYNRGNINLEIKKFKYNKNKEILAILIVYCKLYS